MTDAQRERKRARQRAWYQEKYHSDYLFRLRENERSREWKERNLLHVSAYNAERRAGKIREQLKELDEHE